jgi:hypothetical protein
MAALLAGAAVPAQVQEHYHAASFEPHRFTAGRLPGPDLWSGQDGWVLTGDLTNLPNQDAVRVQGAVARSGTQAVHWDVAQERWEYAHLRRNVQFPTTATWVDVDFDFRLASASQPSEAWGLHAQVGPGGTWWAWYVRPSGELEVLRPGPPHVLVPTGFFVTRDAWHESRTTVHVPSGTWDLVVDGRAVARGIGVITPWQFHAFTSLQCSVPGNDQIWFDNFVVRERSVVPFVSGDLDSLPVGARGAVRFHLHAGANHANRPHLLLGTTSGTTPGITFGSLHVPLNYDGWMAAILGNPVTVPFQGFLGTLNADAHGTAAFDTLLPIPPAALGLTLHHAFVTLQPFDAVSNPVALRLR